MPHSTPSITVSGQPPIRVGTIYAVGRNYAAHAKELGNDIPTEPVIFLKSAAAIRPLAGGELAFANETFHYEAELVLLVGNHMALGALGDWQDVAALGLGIDLTRRTTQATLKANGLPWTLAKSFAGSALVGEFLPRERFTSLERLGFTLALNGEVRQHGKLENMIFDVPQILSYLASFTPLYPGDLVYTGTPEGVGPLRRGDQFVLKFDGMDREFAGEL